MDINILNIKFLTIMMAMFTKQYLSNIWSSIHEEVKQHCGSVERKRCL